MRSNGRPRLILFLLAAMLCSDVAADSPIRQRTDRSGDPLPPRVVARIGTVRWWVGPTEEEYRCCPLAFTPDGKRLASCDEGKAVRFLDAATGQEVQRIEPRDGVTSFALTPDGKRLITASASSSVLRLWEVATGKELRKIIADASGTTAVAFSPNGKAFAAATGDRDIRIWDAARWKLLHRFTSESRFLAFLADGKTLISANDSSISWWAVDTGRMIRSLNQQLYELALSPDGKRVAILEQNEVLHLWDAIHGTNVRRITLGASRGGWCLCFSADGRTLACGNGVGRRGNETIFFAAETGRELRRWDERDRDTTHMAFSPDGAVLAQASSGVLRLRDAATGRPVGQSSALAGPVTAVRFTRGGKALTVSCLGGRTSLADPLSGELRTAFQAPPKSMNHRMDLLPETALTADGAKAALVDSESVLHVWETVSGKEFCRIADPEPVAAKAVFSADGKRLALWHRDDTLCIWDTATGKLVRSISQWRNQFPNALAFSPDGRILASVYSASFVTDRSIRMWDTTTGESRGQFPWPDRKPACLMFTAGGQRLLASYDPHWGQRGARDRVGLCVWDLVTGRELRRVIGPVEAMALSPDERTLATANHGTIRLWELASGKERGHLIGHRERIQSLAFSPDGRLLASGSLDYTACVWDATGVCPDGKWTLRSPKPDELERLWIDLGDKDGVRAYGALWRLAAADSSAVAFLAQRLRPTPRVKEERLTRLLADLDSARFEARERASTALRQLGEQAEPSLRKALAAKPSLEAARRLRILLEQVEGRALTTEQLHTLRAVEVLEHIGSAESRAVLRSLTAGAPGDPLTREAKAALERLTSGTKRKP